MKTNLEKLNKLEINAVHFLNEINSMNQENELVNELRCLKFSRIDLEPETENLEQENYENLAKLSF